MNLTPNYFNKRILLVVAKLTISVTIEIVDHLIDVANSDVVNTIISRISIVVKGKGIIRYT